MGKLKDQQIRDGDAALQPMRVGDLAGLRAHVEANCNRCGHATESEPDVVNQDGADQTKPAESVEAAE